MNEQRLNNPLILLLALAVLAWPAPSHGAEAEAEAKPRRARPAEVVAADAEEADKPAGNVARPQVLIEGMILEWQVNDDFDFNYALRYLGGPNSTLDQLDLTLPADPSLGSAARIFFDNMDIGSGSLDGYIETLEKVGSVKILAQPKIPLTVPLLKTEINNPEIDFGKINDARAPTTHYQSKVANQTRIPYETSETSGLRLVSVTEYRDTGVVLDVAVPAVVGNLVVLDVRASVQDLSGFINVGLNEQLQPMRVPVTEARTIQNRLIVPDRRRYLAGLMKITRKSERRSGIPWLSELPVLSIFLSNHKNRYQASELLFLVRPEILTPYKLIEVDFDSLKGGNQ